MIKDPSTPLRYALPLRAIKQDDAIKIMIILHYRSLCDELQVFLYKKTMRFIILNDKHEVQPFSNDLPILNKNIDIG